MRGLQEPPSGLAILGWAGLGMGVVMTLGKDWKSQAWKRYAEQATAKPRKVARR